MYKVYFGSQKIADSAQSSTCLISPVIKLEENKAGTFTFNMAKTHPHYAEPQLLSTEVFVYLDDQNEPTFAGFVSDVSTTMNGTKTVFCEGFLSYLNDSIQRQASYSGFTVRELLEAYINTHNEQVEERKRFTVGVVTVEDPNNSITCFTNYNSTAEEIKADLVDDLGGFLRVRYTGGQKVIDYLESAPNTNKQVIKIGRNLLDLTQSFDSADIVTRLIPLGASLEEQEVQGLDKRVDITSVNDGLDYIDSDDAISTYGVKTKVVIWDDVNTPSILLHKAEKYLTDNQWGNVTIEATALDLSMAGEDIETFKLSDDIRVISQPHGLNRTFRLTGMTLNLDKPASNSVKLGKTEKNTLTAQQSNVQAVVNAFAGYLPESLLSSAAANATALIASALGGIVTINRDPLTGIPFELLIMDTNSIDTAQSVWRWNVNGLGHSSTGYAGPYRAAITADNKLVADEINVGGSTVPGSTVGGVVDAVRVGNGRIDVYAGGGDDGYSVRINGSGVYVRNNDTDIVSMSKDQFTTGQWHMQQIDNVIFNIYREAQS